MTGALEDGLPESGEHDDYWRDLLTGDPSALPRLSKLFRRMPAAPRCKSCGVPFAGPYTPVLRLFTFKPWPLNEQLCRPCFQGMAKQRGGAEVPVSLLFSDLRDSTTLAERTTPTEFKSIVDRFFSMVFAAVDSQGGVVDHIVGDGVMAMWAPGFGGPEHPRRAVAAGRKLVSDLVADPLLRNVPAGVGVHTGVGWVGVVGETGTHDFTVLGDVPNTTARLGSAGGGGELVMSQDIVQAAAVATDALERRVLDLKGKSEPFTAWVEVTNLLTG